MSDGGVDTPVNIHYGCGETAPSGWLNFDVSPVLRLQRLPLVGRSFKRLIKPHFPQNVRIGDIRKGLPVPANSADRLFCCNILEHLSLEDCRLALKNSRSYLQQGGVFRCVVPDLRRLAQQYLARSDPEASTFFMDATILGKRRRPRGFIGNLRQIIGNANHLWMWDYESLSEELRRAGFVNVRRAHYGDRNDPYFAMLEDEQVWMGHLAIDCEG